MKNKAEKIMRILAAALTAFLTLCLCKIPALANYYDAMSGDEDAILIVVIFGGALIIILAVVISVVSSVVSSIASAVDDEED